VQDSCRCSQGAQGNVPVHAFFFTLQASQARVTLRSLRASLAISDYRKWSGKVNAANPSSRLGTWVCLVSPTILSAFPLSYFSASRDKA
jgi:hypothetical protein